MSDDALIERIAEAIRDQSCCGDINESLYQACAALAVARPAIRDETLAEVERALNVAIGHWAFRVVDVEAISPSIVLQVVRSLRSDSKEGEE